MSNVETTLAERPNRAYIGLGSNLAEPVAQVRRAMQELAGLPGSTRVGCSGLYRSAPMGPPDQPDYINAAVALETWLKPMDLLHELQGIEQRQGRTRGGVRWGPRILDLDLLIYGQERIVNEQLTLPHPGLRERNFVLYPLAEVYAEGEIPGLGRLIELLARSSPQGLVRLSQ